MSSSIAQPLQTNSQKIVAGNNVSNSNGTYTPVFIVVAVVAVLAIISCFIGQCCSRRYLRPRRRRDHVSFENRDIEHGLHMGKIEVLDASKATKVEVRSNEGNNDQANNRIAHTSQSKSSEVRPAIGVTNNYRDSFTLSELPKLFELRSPPVYPKITNSERISQGVEESYAVVLRTRN